MAQCRCFHITRQSKAGVVPRTLSRMLQPPSGRSSRTWGSLSLVPGHLLHVSLPTTQSVVAFDAGAPLSLMARSLLGGDIPWPHEFITSDLIAELPGFGKQGLAPASRETGLPTAISHLQRWIESVTGQPLDADHSAHHQPGRSAGPVLIGRPPVPHQLRELGHRPEGESL